MKICKHKTLTTPCVNGLFGVVVLWLIAGCEMADVANRPTAQAFSVARVRISALTDFAATPQPEASAEIQAFVELLDAYESQLKTACILRFELYDYHPRSANPRGRRLVIWPDANLAGPQDNNRRWKDSLRCYEFNLPLAFVPSAEKTYVLEVTCMLDERRLTHLRKLQFKP